MQPDLSQRAVSTEMCRRTFDLEDIEIREDADTGDYVFEGRASVVDFPYTVRDRWGEYTETIKAGAFNKTLRDSGPVSLYVNHRHSDVPLATRGAGTLTLGASPHLDVSARLDRARPDVQIIASAVRRKEMTQMSIGFNAVKTRDKWNDDMTEVVRGEVALREVSIVEVGANTGGTLASMRSFDDFLATITDTEMTDEEIRRAIEFFQSRLPAHDALDDDAALRVLVDAERAEAEAIALQAEFDWEMSLRRKHPAAV
jgi:HK97 family phage prohead protease